MPRQAHSTILARKCRWRNAPSLPAPAPLRRRSLGGELRTRAAAVTWPILGRAPQGCPTRGSSCAGCCG
jgi:hypothetical protein